MIASGIALVAFFMNEVPIFLFSIKVWTKHSHLPRLTVFRQLEKLQKSSIVSRRPPAVIIETHRAIPFNVDQFLSIASPSVLPTPFVPKMLRRSGVEVETGEYPVYVLLLRQGDDAVLMNFDADELARLSPMSRPPYALLLKASK